MICPDCSVRLEYADGGNTSVMGVRSYYRFCPVCLRKCRVKIKHSIETFDSWVDESILSNKPNWRNIKQRAVFDLIWFKEIQPETLELAERMRTNG